MNSNITRIALLIALMFTASSVVVLADVGEAHAQKKKKKRKIKPMGGLKGGFILTGSGTLDISGGGTSASTDTEDKSVYGLNGFAIFPVSKVVRVGGSIWLFPAVDLPNPDATTNTPDDKKSTGIDLNILGEYLVPVGQFDGFVYGEGGLSILLPPDAEEGQPKNENFLGFNIGGGAGVQFLVSKSLAVRGDLKATYYSVSSTTTATAGGASTDIEATLTGTRFMVNAGVAFGL